MVYSSERLASYAPVQVTGQKSFRLLAVWDPNDRKEGLNRRPGPLFRALNDSSDFLPLRRSDRGR
jgi:hypothetical protein